MKKLILFAALAAIVTGCATKSRSFDAKGMYVSETGQLAIGYVHVDAIPDGSESAVIHYKEDTALLSPSTKTHDIDIILTGTNSTSSARGVVKSICDAFVQVAPKTASADSASKGATSPLDLAKANSDNKKEAKIAAAASGDKAECTTGDCATGGCGGGACSD